jgi:hypothetical protein
VHSNPGTPAGGVASYLAAPASRRSRAVAVRVAALLVACTPVTTRPPFRPDPQALVVLLNARPERITAELATLVPAESLEVARSSVVDGYVETAWYDTRAHRSLRRDRNVADLATTVKLRFWADPYVPGQTRLTIEPVYRPRIDPSRPERDLEVIVSPEDPGYRLAKDFVAKLQERFGTPKAAQ